jgi:hypothetical protein
LAEGKAQIEREKALHVDPELRRERLIEAEPLAQLLQEHFVSRARLACHDLRGVTGSCPDQQKIEDRDREEDDNSFRNAPGKFNDKCHVLPASIDRDLNLESLFSDPRTTRRHCRA